VAITGHAGAAERLWCQESGCTDYVDKPLRRQDIFAPLTRPHAGSGVDAAQARLGEALAVGEEDLERVRRAWLDAVVAEEEEDEKEKERRSALRGALRRKRTSPWSRGSSSRSWACLWPSSPCGARLESAAGERDARPSPRRWRL